MKNESTDIELELQPIDGGLRAPNSFAEQGAAGFSLLPARNDSADDDDTLSLISLERFSFK